MRTDKINIELLKQLSEEGKTIKEISKELKISRSTVVRLKSKYEIKSVYNDLKRENILCLECGDEFSCCRKENRKFCNHSCSASFNNKLKKKKERFCLCCSSVIASRFNSKYCSKNCCLLDKKNKRYELVENSNICSIKTIKSYLIEKYGNKCMKCKWCEVNPISGKVPIELEHIDGNSENNNLENLELLCPNCHSLTPTYKALNIGNGRHSRRERYKEGKSF